MTPQSGAKAELSREETVAGKELPLEQILVSFWSSEPPARGTIQEPGHHPCPTQTPCHTMRANDCKQGKGPLNEKISWMGDVEQTLLPSTSPISTEQFLIHFDNGIQSDPFVSLQHCPRSPHTLNQCSRQIPALPGARLCLSKVFLTVVFCKSDSWHSSCLSSGSSLWLRPGTVPSFFLCFLPLLGHSPPCGSMPVVAKARSSICCHTIASQRTSKGSP